MLFDFRNENNVPKNNDELIFESIKDLIDHVELIFKKSDLNGKTFKVIGDITSAKYSKNGDLYIETSQIVEKSNYSITVYFPSSSLKNIFENNQITDEKYLINKRWEIIGTISLWKRDARFVINGRYINPFGDSEIEKRKLKIIELLKSKNLIRKIEHEIDELPPIKKIAVISSPTAAGYGDFMKNIGHSRYIPLVHLYESPMQGIETSKGIIKALKKIKMSKINYDIIVIIRGGGSKSDLMYFDDAQLGVAISLLNDVIPVLTGIGHEQDTTIPDYVSWKRYSTPTEVSRDIARQINNSHDLLDNIEKNLQNNINWTLGNLEKLLSIKTVDYLSKNIDNEIFYSNSLLDEREKLLDNYIVDKFNFYESKISIEKINYINTFIGGKISDFSKLIDSSSIVINNKFENMLLGSENNLIQLYNKIMENSPFAAFVNGGSIVEKNNQKLTSVSSVKKDDIIKNIFKDGEIESKVITKTKYIKGKNKI